MNQEQFTETVSLKQVTLLDTFWGNYGEVVRKKMLPYQWEALNDRIPEAEASHCIQNFKIAAGQMKGEFGGWVFQDSDVAKWLEAVAFSLNGHPDAELEKIADETIDLIVSAQQEDGYLDTYYIINGLENRFTNLMDNHELYCAGHLIEAAAAFYNATGKRKLLDAMIRYVDLIDSIFGSEEGKKKGYPGHEIIEMALVKLYDITKNEKHLKLASYFIEERGCQPLYFAEETKKYNRNFWGQDNALGFQYYQAGMPVREQEAAEGHAVRAVYLYSGMADVARKTKDQSLYEACLKIWNNLVHKRMYITGAIGSSAYGEAFTHDYDLPNDTVYGETCAAIGLIFFAQRMLMIHPDSEYADVIERTLYNGMISGVSLDGTSFFYVNPLEVEPEACEKNQLKRHIKPIRQKWFGCACCPPNLARITASLPEYIYTKHEDTLFVNLYIGNQTKLCFYGIPAVITLKSGFPWNGHIEFSVSVDAPVTTTIAFRIPGWCRNYTAALNNQEILQKDIELKDGYFYLTKEWKETESVIFDFAMPIELIKANSKVKENIGKVAVMRGPMVYCLEEADNGKRLQNLLLRSKPIFTWKYREDLLQGIVEITSDGEQMAETQELEKLYDFEQEEETQPKELKWIPYYSWANRSIGEMTVWIRKK